MNAHPYIVTEEQLELDRVVRAGLCTRPASGPNAQSIDEAAKEIAFADAADRSLPLEARAHAWEERDASGQLRPTAWSRKVRAALEIIGEGECWDRMRRAAAILHEPTLAACPECGACGPDTGPLVHGAGCSQGARS